MHLCLHYLIALVAFSSLVIMKISGLNEFVVKNVQEKLFLYLVELIAQWFVLIYVRLCACLLILPFLSSLKLFVI